MGQPQTPPAMSRQSPSTATSEPPVESEQTASNSRVPPPPKPMLLTRMNQQPPEAQNQASTRKSLFQRTLNKSDFEPSTSSKASSASTTLASIGSSRKRGKEKEKGRDREKDKERDRVMHGKHSKDSDEERLEILKVSHSCQQSLALCRRILFMFSFPLRLMVSCLGPCRESNGRLRMRSRICGGRNLNESIDHLCLG